MTLPGMPDDRRLTVPGFALFLTVVTDQRRPFLTNPLARRCVREPFLQVCARRPSEVPAIDLPPDHLQALRIRPPGDSDDSVRWRRIKGEFTERDLRHGGEEKPLSASRQRRKERGIWPRGLWYHIHQDEDELECRFHDIHDHPVKHKLVPGPRDCGLGWRYSEPHVNELKGKLKWGKPFGFHGLGQSP